MAQLRDSQTSQIIAEGTPLEMATLASKVGFDQVIFDDVGLGFDPQAVLDAHAERVASMAEIDGVPEDHAAQIEAADKLQRGAIKAANEAIAAARDAVNYYTQG